MNNKRKQLFIPILIIVKKEVKAYFDHPIAYIILIIFLVINNFFYFRSAFLFNIADVRPMFTLLPWLLLFIVPAITMKMLAEEKHNKTLELLLAQPIPEWQILIGKFLGGLSFIAAALALTLFVPLSLAPYGQFDWGIILSQYLGAVMLGSTSIAVGLLASSATKNQIGAFLSAATGIFILFIIGYQAVLLSVPAALKPIMEQLSLSWHYSNVIRGAVDLRDLIYFFTASASLLSVSYWLMVRKNVNPKRANWRRLKIGVAVIIGIAVIINLLGLRIHGRLDLTEEKLYTLSPATKNIIRNLPELVTIDFYRSKELPPEISVRSRDAADLLSDYEIESGGKLNIIYHDIDSKNAAEAEQSGIQPVQFNILKSDEFQAKRGYFGLTVSYLDQQETIPFIETADDFEYQITKLIRKMTNDQKLTVGFLSGHEEKSLYSDYSSLNKELNQQYKVVIVTIDEEAGQLKPMPDILIIAGPKGEINDNEKEVLRNFMASGGRALFLIDTLLIDMQTLHVTANENSLADLAEEFGARVNSNITGDLRSHESISLGGAGGISYILPYPFWPRSVASDNNPITGDIDLVVFPWASSVDSVADTNKESITLLTTTSAGFTKNSNYNLLPDQQFSSTAGSLSRETLALAVYSKNDDSSSLTDMRLVAIGDSDFLTENFVRSDPKGLVFTLNSIDWLAQDEELISVRSKQRAASNLIFSKDGQKNAIKYFNIAGIPLFVAVLGSIRMIRRRKTTKKQYVIN